MLLDERIMTFSLAGLRSRPHRVGSGLRPARAATGGATFGRIAAISLSVPELCALLEVPSARAALADEVGDVVVVNLAGAPLPSSAHVDLLATLPLVVVGLAPPGPPPPAAALVDLVVTTEEAEQVVGVVTAHPLASAALAMLLRAGITGRAGLVAESATYSLLQAGPEFTAWRTGRPVRHRPAPLPGPAVRRARDGSTTEIVLSRPEVHNAYDTAMRDGLVAALLDAAGDPTSPQIVLRGDGPSFCSGGDLDEFGTRPDPATAHLVRLARSPADLLGELSARTTALIHGACRGSGIELPAFAGWIVAAPDTTIGLPEIGMGLIPGAGGTVSLPSRIGRHRTAELALTLKTIDALTAREWGLVDEVRETPRA